VSRAAQAHARVRRLVGVATTLLTLAAISSAARAGNYDSMADCIRAREALEAGIPQITEVDVYRSMGEGFYDMGMYALAGIVPNVGVEMERGADLPAVALSWSGSLPFGPVTACRTPRYSHTLYIFRPLRAVIEGGIVIRSPVWEYLRPGLRAIWHRSSWPIGVGAGVGSTLAALPGMHSAASVSPEILVHYGACCAPGYWLLTLRADVFFPRRFPATASANLGLAFW
jgi:hypothetical protein